VKWKRIQDAKAAVRSSAGYEAIEGEAEWCARDKTDVETDVQTRELLQVIDAKLSVELRSAYLRMRAGNAVPKKERLAVEVAVREILGDACEGLAA